MSKGFTGGLLGVVRRPIVVGPIRARLDARLIRIKRHIGKLTVWLFACAAAIIGTQLLTLGGTFGAADSLRHCFVS